nr:hypothetical protein CFP56_26219 [Quercus suber]
MWVNGTGPFMTNEEFREVTNSSSATESDSETMVMFSLDRLNEDHPRWLRGNAWARGQIPESAKGLIDTLINREGLDRLRNEVEDSSNGPDISAVDTESSTSLPTSVSLDPGFFGCLGCAQELGKKCGPSRKRIGTEIGRLGRNIHQKLMCGFLPREVVRVQKCGKNVDSLRGERFLGWVLVVSLFLPGYQGKDCRNTRYFQIVVRQRRSKNRILHIKDERGVLTDKPEDIENVFVDSFKRNFSGNDSLPVESIIHEFQGLPIPTLTVQ